MSYRDHLGTSIGQIRPQANDFDWSYVDHDFVLDMGNVFESSHGDRREIICGCMQRKW